MSPWQWWWFVAAAGSLRGRRRRVKRPAEASETVRGCKPGRLRSSARPGRLGSGGDSTLAVAEVVYHAARGGDTKCRSDRQSQAES